MSANQQKSYFYVIAYTMTTKLIKHTWQKVVLATVVIITAVALLLAVLINVYFSPILAEKVKTAVLKGTDSLYKIDFSDAKLNILKGEIVISDIHFRPDTEVYDRHKKLNTAPNNLTELRVKRSVATHVHPFKFFFSKKLDIDQIVLSAPVVRVSYELNKGKDTTTVDQNAIWKKMSKTLHSAHVGRIMLNDIKFTYDDHSGKKLATSKLQEMDLRAEDLLIDSTTQTDRSRLFYCKDIITQLHNYKGRTADGSYTYSIKLLKLSTRTAQLNVEGIAIEPDKNYYSKSRKDRYKINLDSAQLNNFDFLTYQKKRILNASSLLFSRGTIDIFKNPNKKDIYKDKINSFPHVALFRSGVDMKIDTIFIKHLNVIYGELNKKAGKSGAISFYNTNGRFLNVTTNKTALQKNNIATVKLHSRFMDHGDFDVFFTFNLTDKASSYSYKGRLGAMDLRNINTATVPLALAKITSGKLKEFTFNVKGNRKGAQGRIQVLYNDLRVKLLKADTANERLKGKTIMSLFANLFIIKDNNPDAPGDIPRSAQVVYTRPINFPFWKTVWKTLLAGIKNNIGMDEKAEQAATKMIDERAIKKAQRKQKRAERKRQRQIKRAQKEAERKSKG